MAKGKYDNTLNLPGTSFPMRANLPKKEPELLRFWDEIDIYQRVKEKNMGRPKYVLHDGPPYANGDIHLGTSMNKVLKDIIVKYKSISSYDAPYVPGWDTHGLPIEQQAIKNIGLDRKKTDVVDFRRHCRDYALKYVDIQREQFRRLGVRGDWNNPYLTLNPSFEGIQIKVFGKMANNGFIYKGLKPVYWCGDCETALAEAEIEYHSKVSPSIYVRFPITDGKGVIDNDTYIIIWTTTPWTLPANVAVALNPELDYVQIAEGPDKYLVAMGLLEQVSLELGFKSAQILKTFKGNELEKIVCKHPFIERESIVVLGDHVTLEAGTGCVHTAPGHGEDDFAVGKIYGLPVISPVNNYGKFTDEVPQFAGMHVQAANKEIIKELDLRGNLLKQSEIEHQYPYCWRCKKPIIYRATEQWFASIEGFRKRALEAIDEVEWIPSWGRDRIFNMIRDRGDWCISRQRTWGVPIPIFYCQGCNETIVNNETIDNVSDLITAHGADIWFSSTAKELLPEDYKCPKCNGNEFAKETDIMDVWFDSGSSHAAVLETHPDLYLPADLYLEGSDQHRGWFNSSLSTAVAIRGQAPYKSVLTHGFIVDEQGRKMSKSIGNTIDPLKMINELGADILRLWVSSADYRNDISVSNNIIKQAAEAYRKIRNTCRFILSNLSDFEYKKDAIAYENLDELEKWILMRLEKLLQRTKQAYEQYEFHVVFHSVHNFCAVDLSNIFFDIRKDNLYCSHPVAEERRATQTVLHKIIRALVVILSPILTYTMEEIWQLIRETEEAISVQLLEWPPHEDAYLDEELEVKISKLLKIRDVVTKVLEEARAQKVIGHSLGADITIYANEEWLSLLNDCSALNRIFIVSGIEIKNERDKSENALALEDVKGIWVAAQVADGDKCERCWTITTTVGEESDHPTLCERCAGVVRAL